MYSKRGGYLKSVISHAIIAIALLVVMSVMDPLGMRSASTMLMRDTVERILRKVPPVPGIWDWGDPRVHQTAKQVAEQIASRNGGKLPEGEPPEEFLDNHLSKWTPIHLILFDELAANTGRQEASLDGAILGLPLEDITGLLRYLAEQGVSVIFIDIRFINEFSYSHDFCGDVIPEWNRIVRKPEMSGDPEEEDGQKDPDQQNEESAKADSRPYLFVAGHAPLVTRHTSEMLWDGRADKLPALAHRDARHTIRPCLSDVAAVLQTEWQPLLGTYPVTVDRLHDPFAWLKDTEKSDRWRYAPAVEMLRAWCTHENAVVRDLDSCRWADSLKPERGKEIAARSAMALDWVHMLPAVYGRSMRERCLGGNEEGNEREHLRVVEQDPDPWSQWNVMLEDVVDQLFLQLVVPVDSAHDRIPDPECLMPAVWDGWLSEYERPDYWNDTFRNALFGSAVIVGTAYENGADWHHSPTTGMVPGARLHSVALQSLIWRGEDYLSDYASVGAINKLLLLEIGMLLVGIMLFEAFPYRCSWFRFSHVFDFGTADCARNVSETKEVDIRSPALWGRGAKADYENAADGLIIFQFVFVLIALAGCIIARWWLNAPVPDIISIGFGIAATYSVRLVESLSDGASSLIGMLLSRRVFFILVVICFILIPTAIALGGRPFYWHLWFVAMALFGGLIVLSIAAVYHWGLAGYIERRTRK
tara:strand:- start:2440 stop:4545 length:2106 start_codon:yes stop_codon:yes gene_type:complete